MWLLCSVWLKFTLFACQSGMKVAAIIRKKLQKLLVCKYKVILVTEGALLFAEVCSVIRQGKYIFNGFLSVCMVPFKGLMWNESFYMAQIYYLQFNICWVISTNTAFYSPLLLNSMLMYVSLCFRYGLMDRYLGNCVTQKQKIQLILCTKLIFHRHFKSVSL